MLGSGSDKEAAAHLKNLNTNCAQFFNNHSAADTCTGRVTYNGVSMTAPVTGATVKNICDQVSQTVLMTPTTTTRNQSKSQTKVSKTQSSMQQPTRTQATRQSSQPDTSASQAALTSIQANQLSLKIINPGDLALTNGSSDKYFQNGQVVSRNDLDYKGVFCKTMESSKGPAQGAQLAGQQILKNPESELKMSHVVVTTTDQTSHLSFLCATGSNSEISTADFKNTLKGAVAVSVR
jgi:hypothetical protein